MLLNSEKDIATMQLALSISLIFIQRKNSLDKKFKYAHHIMVGMWSRKRLEKNSNMSLNLIK